MATATTTTDNPHAKDDESDLKSWCIIWLDANANTEDKQNEEKQLRSIVKHLETFQDAESFDKYLRERSKADKLRLIVSGTLGREIVPSVHDSEEIASIYVYCHDVQYHIPWAKSFSKIKAVVDNIHQLLSEMKTGHKNPTTLKDSFTMDYLDKTTAHVNAQFVFFQTLIDRFLRLEYSPEDRKEVLDDCKDPYDDEKCTEIGYFGTFYLPKDAIYWYTRNSFFFRNLNIAFRTKDFNKIFVYRPYIADIYCQLKENQSDKPLTVYRGQFMSTSEISNLKRRRGQLISLNSFLSTSLEKEIAQVFKSDRATDNLQPVLFEIYAHPEMASTKPFANICKLSAFPVESEVLFMLGSIFRLENIAQNHDGTGWNIKMTLCSENEHDLKDDLEYMKKEFGNGETNYRILGKLLFKMRQYDLARRCFTRCLSEPLENDSQLLQLCEDLEDLEAQTGDHNESLKWQRMKRALRDQISLTYIPINTTTTTPYITILQIPVDEVWEKEGLSVAGGRGQGDANNKLDCPLGLCIDDDDDAQIILIADQSNHRIIQWKRGDPNGVLVAGGNGQGKERNQLNNPSDVLIDKQSNSLLICDRENRRVVR